MESIKEFPRGISDQVISKEPSTEEILRAPGPGLQVTSHKLPGPRPISNANKGLIHKRQASSDKPQANEELEGLKKYVREKKKSI